MKNVNLYRIYTEDVNAEDTENIVKAYFDGFTLIHGAGFWKGGSEDALVIEILGAGDEAERDLIGNLCEDLKKENGQEAILLVVTEVDSFII